MRPAAVSYREAAKLLGVDRATVADLVGAARISPVPVPSNGRAKGLTREHLRALRRLLRHAPRLARAV